MDDFTSEPWGKDRAETIAALKCSIPNDKKQFDFNDLKSEQHKQFIQGMAYAKELIYNEHKTDELVLTGSPTLDKIVSDIHYDVYSYMLMVLFDEMENTLSRFIREEKSKEET